jgi:4-amino-4-deoxy-L-arabinose transferase-like glycosyltransferase
MDHRTTVPKAPGTPGSAGLPAAGSDAGVAGAHRPGRVRGSWGPGWLPLVLVLVAQAGLSIRLFWVDTAFQDEAEYLWAGHLEWSHWLHGTVVPPFASYFSGAPVIYPPLAALADAVGGLAAARLLSLLFMLGATALLWAVAGRLFGRRAAFFSCALFALSGPVLHLGSFATYDAMSVFLLALASWLVVSAPEASEAAGRMALAGVVLALANATAYSCTLFDPVVILLALLTAWPAGARLAIRRVGALVTVTAALLIAAALLGGTSYTSGIRQTTLERAAGSAPVTSVLSNTWTWTGVILVLAAGAIIASAVTRGGARQTWLLAILAAAALAGPLEQANLHTLDALNKHIGLGLWFAAIAAGYTVATFIAAAPDGRSRAYTTGACVAALTFPISLGITQSYAFDTSWPDSASFTAIFGPLTTRVSGPLLVEDPSIAEYYLPEGHNWQRWSSTRNIVLPTGANIAHPSRTAGVTGDGNAAAFARYISRHYFALVALNYADTITLDHTIKADLTRAGYRVLQVVPYGDNHGTYIIYGYEPPK